MLNVWLAVSTDIEFVLVFCMYFFVEFDFLLGGLFRCSCGGSASQRHHVAGLKYFSLPQSTIRIVVIIISSGLQLQFIEEFPPEFPGFWLNESFDLHQMRFNVKSDALETLSDSNSEIQRWIRLISRNPFACCENGTAQRCQFDPFLTSLLFSEEITRIISVSVDTLWDSSDKCCIRLQSGFVVNILLRISMIFCSFSHDK